MKNIDRNFFKSKQKKRNYLHFDEKRSPDYLYSYVTKPSNIIRHSFYPFISYNRNEKKSDKAIFVLLNQENVLRKDTAHLHLFLNL